VQAQQLPRISILHSGFPNRTPIRVLYDELDKLGYEDGRTADIEVLGGEGDPDRLNRLVTQLAAQRLDVVVSITSPAVLALKRAGLTAPVVFAFVPDPIGLGVVESLARPGGNFTGITYSDTVLGGKRLELLVDAVPGTRRVAFVWSRALAEAVGVHESIRASARPRDIDISSHELHQLEDLVPAFDAAARAGAQGMIFMSDNLFFGHRKLVAELALARRLPSIHSFATEAHDGALMSYGPSMGENYRRAAALVDRILKGARPADLPVEQPTRFELVINLRTAAALGLTIPPSLLARADEVIE
jgi:ABC-type uncharacterized transport system substrate-binding protein